MADTSLVLDSKVFKREALLDLAVACTSRYGDRDHPVPNDRKLDSSYAVKCLIRMKYDEDNGLTDSSLAMLDELFTINGYCVIGLEPLANCDCPVHDS